MESKKYNLLCGKFDMRLVVVYLLKLGYLIRIIKDVLVVIILEKRYYFIFYLVKIFIRIRDILYCMF